MNAFWQRHHHKVYIGVIGILIVALIAAIVGASAGYFYHTQIAQIFGRHGIVEPPIKAQTPSGAQGDPNKRGRGLKPPQKRIVAPHVFGGVLPVTVDLSQYSPPVGNQGNVNSCVAWALGYYLRGWYAARDHKYPNGGFAPMYVYTQINHGQNAPTYFSDAVNVLDSQGIAPLSNYSQGNYDYINGPTSSERSAAAPWTVQSPSVLFAGDHQGTWAQNDIEASIAAGQPVVIGLPVNSPFWNAGAASYYVDSATGTYYGGHAVYAAKYDANGLWIENQWGTGWGLNGWAELSWNFVNTWVYEALTYAVPRPVLPPTVTPTPRPTAHPTPKPKVTPRPTPNASYHKLIVAMYLRPKPQTSPSSKTLIAKGQTVKDWGKQPTNGWRHITWHSKNGYLLSKNLGKA